MNWDIPDRAADIVLVIAGIPPSKKNSQRIVKRRDGSPMVIASQKAKGFEAALALLAQRCRNLGDHYIAVCITVDEAEERTRIEVWDLGPQPAKGPRHTRRDVHNTADVVMDALQRLAFNDDRQARIVITRHGTVPCRNTNQIR